MTYRSLLVLLDQDPLCAARSQVAMRLAEDLDCHLVGVAPTGLIALPVSSGAATSLAEFAALAWDTLRDQADQAAQRFRDECRAAGVKSFEAVIDESGKAPSLVRHAHCSDLTVRMHCRCFETPSAYRSSAGTRPVQTTTRRCARVSMRCTSG